MKKYTIPESGYYLVSAQVRHATPVGEARVIPNPDKKWWQFWKPDHIIHQEWSHHTTYDGSKILLCSQGEVIDSEVLPVRLSAIAKGTD
jgi:hypothetical protein